MSSRLINFKVHGDERGSLIALEENHNAPFDVKRVFYIYGTHENVPRGQHSHYKTKQLLIAINGGCKITLDDGNRKETYSLNKPNIGLFQDALVWGTMHDFSNDCILVVLSDAYYDADDYITDYENFLQAVKNAKN